MGDVLSDFDIEYIDKKAIKGQFIADQLAEAFSSHIRIFKWIHPSDDIIKDYDNYILMNPLCGMEKEQAYSSSHLKEIIFWIHID